MTFSFRSLRSCRLRSRRSALLNVGLVAICFGGLSASPSVAQTGLSGGESFSSRATGGSATPLSTRAGRTSDTVGADARIANVQDDAYFQQYEEQLNAILKTRRDEEKAFVGAIVEQIRLGNLTTRLVNTSFKWVRTKRAHVNYPFVYFERVLRLLAQKQGIADVIPPFDKDLYNRLPTSALRGGEPASATDQQ